jgi:hypothetical protein
MDRALRAAPALLCTLLVLPRPAAAQTPAPPIQGVTGTIATDASRDGVKKAAGAAARGVKKVLPGGKVDAQDPLETLIEGSRVVVQEAAAPDMRAEGVVIEVNKKRQQITVRVGDKKTQTLRVLDGAHAASDTGARVFVSLAAQAGEKVAYEFTRVP